MRSKIRVMASIFSRGGRAVSCKIRRISSGWGEGAKCSAETRRKVFLAVRMSLPVALPKTVGSA